MEMMEPIFPLGAAVGTQHNTVRYRPGPETFPRAHTATVRVQKAFCSGLRTDGGGLGGPIAALRSNSFKFRYNLS